MAEFQEFKCKICEKVLSNLKFYTDHIKLHQNISNFNFPCPFPTCQRKYTKASSLRAHIARDHGKVVNKLTLEHSRLTSLNCNVRFCEQTCNESSDLIAHLQAHIRKNDTVLCPYGCGKTFSKRSTFSAHLSRKHRYMAQIPERSYSIQSTSAENSAVQEERLAGTTSDELKVQSANIYLSLAQFCLRLITKFHVPYSAVDVIMSQISSIHDLTQENLLCCMKTELGKFETISDYDRTEILKKFSDNNLFTEVFSNRSLLKTDYLRKKYFKENFNYIEPITIKLGRNKQNKIATYHYVPILKSLAAFVQHPSIKRQLLNPILPNEQNVLCDYTDGSIFKAMPFFQDSKILKIFLYQDSFETVNPLGSAKKKHKILAVYYTLGNIFPLKCRKIYEFMRCQNSKQRLSECVKHIDHSKERLQNSTPEILGAFLLLLAYFEEDERFFLQIFKDLPNIDDVENQCPVLTPFLGVFGGDIYNAEEYVVFLDGKASTHTDNVFSAVAILFSAYYVFNIEYPSEACVTMEFIQRVFAEINPDRGTKCPKNKNIAMKKVLNLSNKLMCFQNIFNLPAYSNV